METPFSLITGFRGKRARFGDIPIGAMFGLNGNIWQKRTTRTAVSHWPACLPEWAYFRKGEVVTHDT
jgi:hypothetical protein